MKIDSDLVRDLRNRHGMSQESLAEAAGLSARTIQRLERGGVASMETAMALASVFEIDADALEDTSLEQARLLRSIERGHRFGTAGVALGAVGAVAGVGLDFANGGTSAATAGMSLGVIGLLVGAVSAVLGWLLERQRRSLAATGEQRSRQADPRRYTEQT
ncbi:MAG: helix-turn-helix domain-containing protein [Xanthomonadaceae bacterium]|nr:helix-turn-helix domain-containing protein [Xanthomonadaceae bacterium]